jgi:hypothetical protein
MKTKVVIRQEDFTKVVGDFVLLMTAWTNKNSNSILFQEGLRFPPTDDEEYVFIIKKSK